MIDLRLSSLKVGFVYFSGVLELIIMVYEEKMTLIRIKTPWSQESYD